MKHSKTTIIGILFSSLLIGTSAAQSRPQSRQPPSDQIVAELLGWVPSNDAPCELCGGYYSEPKIIREHPTPLSYKRLPTRITAKGPTIFSQSGQSILQKDVRVTQPGRLTKADKAYIYRDKKTGKITHVKLVGHVRMQESGELIVSNKAILNLKEHTVEMQHVAYHIYQESSRMGKYNGWGTAEQVKRLATGIIKLQHASYSTYSPLKPT